MNAIFFYKIGNWCYRYHIPVVPKVCTFLIFILFNSIVPYKSKIGKKSKLAYGGIGVVIHKNAIIGEKVIIGQNTTIGRSLHPSGVPIIGNNVYIGAGSRILGNIKIGDNVIIGANSVVIRDVPSNSIIAGVPAKLIKSIDVNIYDLLQNIY